MTGEWIQVSPHRSKRPWQGQVEKLQQPLDVEHDASCYLCPGNARSNGELNPRYESTFAFTNDFSAIVSDVPEGHFNDSDLLVAKSERGICKVICFSPKHNLTIPELTLSEIEEVVKVWVREFVSLGKFDFINYVQIFENKGEVMGCSNPHPHGQIWAQESIPVEPQKKQVNQLSYYSKNGRTLLYDYLRIEEKKRERIVTENDHFTVLVPFWATWPFETMIIPKRPMSNIAEMTDDEASAFAQMYKEVTTRYDSLFESSFPYSAGIHQAPTDNQVHSEWHWHMVFYPPMLRSASIKKFMVGYEMLANPQRDITAETSAEKLRSASPVHYKKKSYNGAMSL